MRKYLKKNGGKNLTEDETFAIIHKETKTSRDPQGSALVKITTCDILK